MRQVNSKRRTEYQNTIQGLKFRKFLLIKINYRARKSKLEQAL